MHRDHWIASQCPLSGSAAADRFCRQRSAGADPTWLRGGRHAWIAVLGTLLLAVGGCAEDGPKLVSVSGVVTLKDKPLPNAGVIFSPVDLKSSALLATGRTDEKGKFTLNTNQRSGAVVGSYRVSLWAAEETPVTNDPSALLAPPIAAENSGTSGSVPKPKLLIPEKYTDPAQSGLSFAVKASGANHYEIKLEAK